ncbi:MAG: hypothetical protein B6I20_12265 [Bacteroidetes bacterium 4572_117]|nr:MAG: hypothetical protein B6I20_12265 [Bacteroidetes bacterium 4572_117]
MKIDKLLEKYTKHKLSLSIEEEKEILYKYVYATNKLEGNKLSLAQTTQLLSSDTISGDDISFPDVLEQKGMFKALIRMLKAVKNNEELSIELILELNWIILSSLWKNDSSYVDVKLKGQKEGDFKTSDNVIIIKKSNEIIKRIAPLSTPRNVKHNMKSLIATINKSDKHIIEKAAFLAQEIWLHQPFFDGNKRTGRLLINFMTMKKMFPLFVFDNKNNNYNNILVKQYLESKPNLISTYINQQLSNQINYYLDLKKSIEKNTGFRMIL